MRKFIIITASVMLLTASAKAGWFDNKEQIRDMQQQVESQRQATGGWQIVAGILGIGAVVLFTVGTAIGSKVRRHGKRE